MDPKLQIAAMILAQITKPDNYTNRDIEVHKLHEYNDKKLVEQALRQADLLISVYANNSDGGRHSGSNQSSD